MKTILRQGFEKPDPQSHASQGLPPSVDELTYQWIVSQDDHVSTNDLYLSDIGGCPRKKMLKLKGVTVDLSQHAMWHRMRMFQQANNVADDLAEAFHHDKRLLAMEESISDLLPVNWGGRFDLLVLWNRSRFWEVKSSHPNAIRYAQTLPKRTHVWQALAYEVWAGEQYGTEQPPIVHNADRGGENPSIVSEIIMPEDWFEMRHTIPGNATPDIVRTFFADLKDVGSLQIVNMCDAMLELEAWLDDFKARDIIPPPLDRAPNHRTSKVSPHETTKEGGEYVPVEIYMDRDWRCRQCDYCDTSICEPPKGTTSVLEYDRKTNTWHLKKNGRPYLGEVLAYVKDDLRLSSIDLEDEGEGGLLA